MEGHGNTISDMMWEMARVSLGFLSTFVPGSGCHSSPSICPDLALALVGDLQALAATATGYYDGPTRQPGGNQGYAHPNGTGYYAPTQQPSTSSYGQVYYALNNGAGDPSHHASFDSRRRDYEALNNFFGDAKLRHFNPASYAEVGDRLMAFQGLQLPMIHGGVMPDYQSAPPMVSVGGGDGRAFAPMPQHQYALPPMPNLRTKNDLLNIDQFLEQMQATVYENPNTAAAAGVAHPGTHTAHGGMNFRQSGSPPSVQLSPAHAVDRGPTASAMVPTSSQSAHGGTPALTPPSSSAVSHTSGNSPMSARSDHSSSPHPPHAAGVYPTLPVTGAQATTAGYPSSSTAPVSVLGTSFDNDQRRRYGGGVLQKASKPPRESEPDEMDTSEGTATPVQPVRKSEDNPAAEDGTGKKATSPSLIDPNLSAFSSPADTEAEKAQETWVENIRVIEALRKFIAEKLEKGDYDDETGTDEGPKDATDERKTPADRGREMTDAESLYPVLKAVESHA